MTLPSVGFGAAGALPDWRQLPDPPDPDDELLSKTPPDVVAMLGFDPLELTADAWKESDHPRGQPENAGEFVKVGVAGTKHLQLGKLKQVGHQLGSNPGGTYQAPDGSKYYVKQSKSDDHAKNELLASRLYEEAGAPVLRSELVDLPNGKLGTATEWKPGAKPINKNSAEQKREAQRNFAVHAWLANWDAVGLEWDNQAKIDGAMTTLDVGGALNYRAQGAPKGAAFGDKVTEWDTLRSPQNKQAYSIFGDMTDKDLRASAERLKQVDDGDIRDMVNIYGPGDAKAKRELGIKLVKRKHDVLHQAGLE